MKKRTAAILMTLVMLFSVVTALGEEKWTCPECGKRNAVSMGDICPYCGTHRHIHTWQDATCTEPRTCTGCGETEGEPAGHDWDDGVVTKAATCVNEGNMTYTCTTCGETKQKTIEKNENEHAAETEVRGYKEATCVEDGYSGDVYCKGCEAMINGGETIAATGEHEWDEATYDAPKTCRVCGATEGKPLVRVKVGDYITYGTYPQTAAGNDSTPIEWLVLEYDEKNNKALLISRYGLDCQPYNSRYISVTWETCSLRTWLNGTFLNKAFSKAEQGAILTTNVDNSSSQYCSEWFTDGGNNTQDKVFLLSCSEANKYFNVVYWEYSGAENNTKSRIAPTAYAIAQGAYTSSSYKTADGSASGWWWLRSPGSSSSSAAYVYSLGARYNSDVNDVNIAVRPAFWLDLSGI